MSVIITFPYKLALGSVHVLFLSSSTQFSIRLEFHLVHSDSLTQVSADDLSEIVSYFIRYRN